MFQPSHLVFEPRDARETLGLLWLILAAAGLTLVVRSVVRAIAVWHAGRRLLSAESRSLAGVAGVDEVVGFDGVSLAGVLHPRILIGAEVARTLTSAELDVAVAHERAHGEALDNVARWSLLCAPDFFGGSAGAVPSRSGVALKPRNFAGGCQGGAG